MTDNDIARIERRLNALERQCRVLRWLFAAALVALAVLPFTASAQEPSQGQTVRASRFEVLREGKVVAYLGSTKDGGSLDISNVQGKTVGYFDSTEQTGGLLVVGSSSSQPVVQLDSTLTGDGVVRVRPSYLNPELGANSEAEVELHAGVTGGRLYLRNVGKAGVVLEGNFHAQGGRLALLDANSKILFAAPR